MTLLTAGFSKVCTPNTGGVKNIWLGNRKDIASAGFTLASGIYTAVTMEVGKVFFKFEFDEDTAEFRPAQTFENNTVSVNSEIEMSLSGLSQSMRDRMQEIAEASACGLVAVVEDSNSVKWVVGYSENFPTNINTQGRPLKLRTNEGTTGKLLTDSNLSVLTLGANDNELPRTFSGNVPV